MGGGRRKGGGGGGGGGGYSLVLIYRYFGVNSESSEQNRKFIIVFNFVSARLRKICNTYITQ